MRQLRFWVAVSAISAICGFGGAVLGVLALGDYLRGPAGAQGPVGPKGEIGASGARGPAGPAGPEPAPPPDSGVTNWAAAYDDLAQRLSAAESEATAPSDCMPMKVVTRVENRYDPLASPISGSIGITAYTGYACAAH